VLSCRKERIDIFWQELPTPTNAVLYDITFTHADTGYAVGGFHWQHGEWLRTTDGGSTWRSDTFANTAMLDLQIMDDGAAMTVGFDGNNFYKTNTTAAWQSYFPSEQETLNAVDFFDKNTGVAVGGKNFEYGVDGGLTWQPNSIQGDFFFALDFPTSEVGYAVGRSGTIIKTANGGEDWKKLRNGNNLFVSNEKFRDVWFKTEDEGYIIGDNGLFWQTEDGGDSWKIAEDTPNVTFNRIFYQNGTGYIACNEGKIYRFTD